MPSMTQAKRKQSSFQRWKARVPPATKALTEQVELLLVSGLEAAGFAAYTSHSKTNTLRFDEDAQHQNTPPTPKRERDRNPRLEILQ